MAVQVFCNLLVRSRLYSPEQVRALYQRWQVVAVEPANLLAFRAWLLGNNTLTAYQLDLLNEGHIDNFFLNQYKILERIGKGRMAGVYKAVDPQGQVVAIKVLPPSKAKNPQLWARFQREARLAMQLDHSGVVRTFDCGVHKNLYFLVMEYLQGETLEAVLRRRGKLTPLEAARIAFLAAQGLQHIHEQGMVHRDLKPGNLMLCPAPAPFENTLRSMVKILDIGLGRVLFDPSSREAKDELTNEGTLLGTPDYLAPEQARDARLADIRADIYSLGCTLYEALSGTPPFADDNLVRQILRHATQQPRPLEEVSPEIRPGLSEVVATMLAKDPNQRYQTPAQTAEALKRVMAKEPQAGHRR
jgi:serine/threonine protein kinase